MASAVSIKTFCSSQEDRAGGGGEWVKDCRAQPSPLPCSPLLTAHPELPWGGGSTRRKHLWIPYTTPPMAAFHSLHCQKRFICSISDLRAWTNGWRPGVTSLLLALFHSPINHLTLAWQAKPFAAVHPLAVPAIALKAPPDARTHQVGQVFFFLSPLYNLCPGCREELRSLIQYWACSIQSPEDFTGL